MNNHTKIQKFIWHGDSECTLNERIRLPKHLNSVVLKTEKPLAHNKGGHVKLFVTVFSSGYKLRVQMIDGFVLYSSKLTYTMNQMKNVSQISK